jgi:hypothetical protein
MPLNIAKRGEVRTQVSHVPLAPSYKMPCSQRMHACSKQPVQLHQELQCLSTWCGIVRALNHVTNIPTVSVLYSLKYGHRHTCVTNKCSSAKGRMDSSCGSTTTLGMTLLPLLPPLLPVLPLSCCCCCCCCPRVPQGQSPPGPSRAAATAAALCHGWPTSVIS